jgi:hypothetical protein
LSIELASAIRNQMLQTLLQAMQAADQPLRAGASVQARFLSWATPAEAKGGAVLQARSGSLPEATGAQPLAARVEIAGRPVLLMLHADAARRAALQPGAALSLMVEAPPTADEPAQLRLLSIDSGGGRPEGTKFGAGALQAQGAERAQSLSSPPASPREALRAAAGPVIGAALSRQDGLGPAFADLARLAAQPGLPAAVVAAARHALAARLDEGEKLDGPALEKAIRQSGLLHEADALAGRPAIDLKGALLTLRQALTAALPQDGAAMQNADAALRLASGEGEEPALPLPKSPQPADQALRGERGAEAQPGAAPQGVRPPPPLRDALPLPQAAAEGSIRPEDSGSVMMAKALGAVDAALDRISIAQYASLPSPQEAASAPLQRWFAELPLALPTGTAIMPIEIEEDRGGARTGAAQARLWRMRFALDAEPMGPVHGLVTMQGQAIGVSLWAERDATRRLAADHAQDLREALLDGFERAEIEIMAGRPRREGSASGHFLDRTS